jgi:hypothetical protein
MTWDGRLVPCCFDKNAEQELGRADERGVRPLWKKGAAYRQFRQRLLGGRQQISLCTNCSEGVKLWV